MKLKKGDIIIGQHDIAFRSIHSIPRIGERYKIDIVVYSESVNLCDASSVETNHKVYCCNIEYFISELEHDKLKFKI